MNVSPPVQHRPGRTGDSMAEAEPTTEPKADVWWARFMSRRLQFVLDIGVLAGAFGLA